MRYLWSQAAALLAQYDGATPLAHILRQHFQSHPALGSRDRRLLSALLYAWYRCGKGLSWNVESNPAHPQLLWQAALLLTQTAPVTARLLPAEWAPFIAATKEKKLLLLAAAGISFNPEALLPPDISFSKGISRQQWLDSMLRQPRLFLRIRHSRKHIEQLLAQQQIAFHWLSETCLSLPNGTAAEQVLPAGSFVVQDATSQQTGNYFQPKAGETWWDSCCGAGGKTLLLADSSEKPAITASDIRPAILQNLKKRFKQYHLPLPRLLTLDAADATAIDRQLGNERFDGIICDAPCSGSGTWARTPEQLYFFHPEKLQQYAAKQQQVVANLPRLLQPGGQLIYITCSVFAEENEKIVENLLETQPLQLIESRLLNGIAAEADCLFVAVLERTAGQPG